MKYIIDTDILIHHLINTPKVVDKFLVTNYKDIATSIINYMELLFGAYNSERKEENIAKITKFLSNIQIVNMDKNSAKIFAEIKSKLKRNGNLIADMDLMIASICLANDLILVTNNTKLFSRIDGLVLENWSL